MSNEELLQQGIAIAKAGDFTRAAPYFAQIIRADPASEQGWFWLGLCVPSSEQREYCFQRVLALNPDNEDARQQLELLSSPGPISPPEAPSLQPPPAGPASSPQPAPPPPPAVSAVSPFIFDEQADEKAETQPPVPDTEEPFSSAVPPAAFQAPPPPTPLTAPEPFPAETAEPTPPATAPEPPQTEAGEPTPPAAQEAAELPPKKANTPLAVFLALLMILLLCSAAAAYLYFTGRLAGLLPVNPAPSQSPLASQNASPTLVPSPTASFTPLTPTATVPPPTATSTSIPTLAPTVAYSPVYQISTCDFDIPEGVVVNCGYVTVPEDRTNPQSKTIQLAVAVYHSLSQKPSPNPVMFLQGGPGAGALKLSAEDYAALVQPFLQKRDFIVFDQRGTGLSKPELGCQELTDVYKQDIHGQVPASSRNLVYSNAFRSCHGAMSISGIDLNAYTTLASAADVKDILTVLGYKQVNLYGASYGTRLAQVVMRDYPDIVHSAVVDSVVPIETKVYNANPAAIEYALKTLFDNCSADTGCNTAYPQLENVFWQLVDQLDAKPVSVTAPLLTGGTITEDADGSRLINVVLGLLKGSVIAPVPQSIYQIKNGDYSVLIAAQSSLPFAFEGISPGLYISMMCHEHILATNLQELQSDLAGHHGAGDLSRLPFFGSLEDLFTTCNAWGALPPANGENIPVTSNIPTLILTGKYDPATPPTWAKQLANHLNQAYYFEFPEQGHTPTAADPSGCAMDIVQSFLDNPTKSPNHTCLDKMNEVQFILPYTGTPPLELKPIQENGFTVSLPTGWTDYGSGIYLRAESPLDITQIGVLETSLTSTELLQSLSSKMYGYGGFDAAPVQTTQLHTNGLDWSLFTTTSYGRPVDLAMADIGKETLVVLLFCYKDEHDALYETVYLPIIASATPVK